MARRTAGFLIALVVAAACRPQSASLTGVQPRHRPKAHIHAEYSGSGVHRQVHAQFGADRDAYVLVGHVAGNGRVQILFPANASDPGQIKGGQTYEVPSFAADYDASPSLYSLSPAPYRSAGAQLDSYDGAGHAFIFIISSGEPLDYQSLSDAGQWPSFELFGYWYNDDPRYEIKEFADDVSGGAAYSLEFAHSFNTTKLNAGFRPTSFNACSLYSSYAFVNPMWMWVMPDAFTYATYLGRDPWYSDNIYSGYSPCSNFRPVIAFVNVDRQSQQLATLHTRPLKYVPGIPRSPDAGDASGYRHRVDYDPMIGLAGHQLDATPRYDMPRGGHRSPTGDYTTRRSTGTTDNHMPSSSPRSSSPTPRPSSPPATTSRPSPPPPRPQPPPSHKQ